MVMVMAMVMVVAMVMAMAIVMAMVMAKAMVMVTLRQAAAAWCRALARWREEGLKTREVE